MKVQQVNTEERIVSIASSIESDPGSWKNWSALHVRATDCEGDDFIDVVITAKAIIESYLKDVEGAAYFCNEKDIYIICKNVPENILAQTANQIKELVFKENFLSCTDRIYNLGKQANSFAEEIFNDVGEKFSIHVTNGTDLKAKTETDIKPENGAEPPSNALPPKVLLVEDDAVTRWMVQSALQDECEFASADTANKVFSLYATQNPDIVLLDIGLPDNNGNAVLEWIMRNDPGACVIMLSGKGSVDNISDCIKTGAKGFISKPFVKQDLMDYIRKYA